MYPTLHAKPKAHTKRGQIIQNNVASQYAGTVQPSTEEHLHEGLRLYIKTTFFSFF